MKNATFWFRVFKVDVIESIECKNVSTIKQCRAKSHFELLLQHNFRLSSANSFNPIAYFQVVGMSVHILYVKVHFCEYTMNCVSVDCNIYFHAQSEFCKWLSSYIWSITRGMHTNVTRQGGFFHLEQVADTNCCFQNLEYLRYIKGYDDL